MKKILLSSAAAAALVVVASAAHAADPVKLTVGGYLQEWVGYATNQANATTFGPTTPGLTAAGGAGVPTGGKYQQVDVKQDAELKFTGSTKTDAGVTFGVEFAINPGHGTAQETRFAAGQNSAAKRAFATASGAFGSVGIGEMENVASTAHNTAPDEGAIYTSDGFFDAWVLAPVVNATDVGNEASIQTTFGTNMPSNKVTYMTPQFAGFQGGVDYTPNINTGIIGHYGMPSGAAAALARVGGVPNGGAFHEVVTYGGNLGPVALAADVGAEQESYAHTIAYDAGLKLSMNGFTLAGSAVTRGTAGGAVAQVAGARGQTWDLGVGYENGPWGVSLSYMKASARDLNYGIAVGTASANGVNGGPLTSRAGNDTSELWLLGAGYAIGPGIKITGNLFNVTWKSADGLAGLAHTSNQNKGWGAVSGLNVQF